MTYHDRRPALHLYGRMADTYDLATAWLEPYRHRAVSELRLQPGDVVLDIGCGTGMSFRPIREAIGAEGRLVGIDPSPEMLARTERSRSPRSPVMVPSRCRVQLTTIPPPANRLALRLPLRWMHRDGGSLLSPPPPP